MSDMDIGDGKCCRHVGRAAIKRASKWVMKNVISFGKDLSSGIGDGIDAGRKASISSGGTTIVSNYTELSKVFEIRMIGVKAENAQNNDVRSVVRIRCPCLSDT
jgi:hypothetical protein